MTRKRFIKMVMSKGYSRNSAVELAKLGPTWPGGYEALYHTYFSLSGWLDHFTTVILPKTIASICDALASGVAAVAEVATSIAAGFAEISRQYREEIRK